MFARVTTLNEFNREYLQRLMEDIAESELDTQPHSQLHSVRWILAHLAIVADYGFLQLGMPMVCDRTWHAAYGPTSQPGTSANVHISREQLLSTISRSYSDLCVAAQSARTEQLAEIHEVALLKNTALKTKGDLLAHILTTHFAAHLGQLSTLRQLAGNPPLF